MPKYTVVALAAAVASAAVMALGGNIVKLDGSMQEQGWRLGW